MLDDLKARARRDFDALNMEEWEWSIFFKGYLAAVKRFGKG